MQNNYSQNHIILIIKCIIINDYTKVPRLILQSNLFNKKVLQSTEYQQLTIPEQYDSFDFPFHQAVQFVNLRAVKNCKQEYLFDKQHLLETVLYNFWFPQEQLFYFLTENNFLHNILPPSLKQYSQ